MADSVQVEALFYWWNELTSCGAFLLVKWISSTVQNMCSTLQKWFPSSVPCFVLMLLLCNIRVYQTHSYSDYFNLFCFSFLLVWLPRLLHLSCVFSVSFDALLIDIITGPSLLSIHSVLHNLCMTRMILDGLICTHLQF